jgi:alkaline phosphatase D
MTRRICWIACLLCLSVASVAVGEDDEGSEEQPGGKTGVLRGYKQLHRRQITRIARGGDLDASIEYFALFLEFEPNDLESLYGIAVAQAQKRRPNKIASAVKFAQRALDAGLPIERFLAGPRDLLRPLTESPEFQKLAKKHPVELLHGPMLGRVTDSSASFWVRTAREVPVQILVSESPQMKDPIKSPTVRTSADRDFTAITEVDKLQGGKLYHYNVLVDGETANKGGWSFRTFPRRGAPAKFQIAFGGGAGYTPPHERMWDTVASHEPLAMLLLGDNAYIDTPEVPAAQRYCYYRRQSRPEFRRLVSSTPVYAIYDDHDFADNDCAGGPEIESPPWKRIVWNIFRENWVNPGYGGGEKNPGCWFAFSIGDVDFFMLDGRYYRHPSGNPPSMLGPVQKKWLLQMLKNSKGTFKVIVSPVPWAFGAKPGSRDAWEGFKSEREEILGFLETNRIDGVVLLSADRHRSDIWRIPRGGYDLYEFESSRLTNIHTHPVMKGSLFGYNEKCSFGLLGFDTTTPDPEIVHRIINIDNKVVHTFTVKKSQLTHTK